MDDFFNTDPGEEAAGGIFDDESDGDMQYAIIGLVHLVAAGVLMYFVRRCCCRSKEAAPQNDEEPTALPEHVQPKKRLLTGYVLLFCGGIFGIHHFYLDRLVQGLIACWSFNFFGMGWLLDLFLMPHYVRSFNRERADTMSPWDGSRRQIFCKLPLWTLSTVALIGAAAFSVPWMLQRAGVVDIDRLAAQTEVNPYDLLEIPYSASTFEAKTAYRKLSLKWHPDRNPGCGKECDHKMSEIGKAFDLIKKRQAPVLDKSWDGWLRDLGRDWQSVLEVLSTSWESHETSPEEPKPTKEGKKESGKKDEPKKESGAKWKSGRRKGKKKSEL